MNFVSHLFFSLHCVIFFILLSQFVNEKCHKNLKTLMKKKTNFENMEMLFGFEDDNDDNEREKE